MVLTSLTFVRAFDQFSRLTPSVPRTGDTTVFIVLTPIRSGHNWGPLPSPTTDWSSVPLSVLTPFRLLPRLQGMHSSVISFPRLVTDPCPEPLGLGAWGSLYQTYRASLQPTLAPLARVV